MSNEEFTQKNDALSEKELGDVSGGGLKDAVLMVAGAGRVCPKCGLPAVPTPEGVYQCKNCGWSSNQGKRFYAR